ncbi:OsmC family protein [Ulvibacter antarcticus]|uniref:Putative redox protein n=1 Tax=Ulvibacter antarcticus TaxID=442714 RepID=A0A3L9Y939_9FLAO|nr:OsmC family protein [Ulvibacter antarcticus]RMA57216.1 putative redox protein [Ulvibacter antarcticus]
MKVILNRIDDNYLFDAKGPNDVSVLVDNKQNNVVNGASPMELILMAVGGCNAIDIISILKKQRQEVKSYKIEVVGKRKDTGDAKPFEAIHLSIFLEGDIAEAKAKRAAELSFEKYCSVSITLSGCVAITYDIILNGIKI